MHIDKFKKDDGFYDEDDVFYGPAEDFIQSKIFGFCGCGDPEENLKFILAGLSHINDKRPKNLDFDVWWKQWIKRGHEIFGNERSRQFFFYWADKEGFTEHGGCVPGWLTEKGKNILEDITELITQELNRKWQD